MTPILHASILEASRSLKPVPFREQHLLDPSIALSLLNPFLIKRVPSGRLRILGSMKQLEHGLADSGGNPSRKRLREEVGYSVTTWLGKATVDPIEFGDRAS